MPVLCFRTGISHPMAGYRECMFVEKLSGVAFNKVRESPSPNSIAWSQL